MMVLLLITMCCVNFMMIINYSAAEKHVRGGGKSEMWTCKNCLSNWNIPRKKSRNSVKTEEHVEIHVNTRSGLCHLDRRFLSFSIDAIEMKRKFRCFPMQSRKLNTLAKALSPAYLRVGGTPQDFATFTKDTDSDKFDANTGKDPDCQPRFEGWKTMKSFDLPMRYFIDIAKFSKRNGFELIFGLNALTHRNANHSWDESESLKLIEHAHKNNFSLSWELGNEPNRYRKYGKSYSVAPHQLAKDYQKLKVLVKTDKIVGPSIASRNPKALKYLKSFLEGPQNVDATTYHHYFMHESVSSVDKYLNPVYLAHLEEKMREVKLAKLSAGSISELWLGESGSSSGGGARNLSDTYAAGFLYLGTLGLASKLCHKVVIRQSLYGGYYGMIDSVNHEPLPDFWTSVLFKRLVGKVSLKLHMNSELVNVQAYCSKENPDDITLVVINFSRKKVTFSIPRYPHHHGMAHVLTADDIRSKSVRLNGKILRLEKDDSLPSLNGILTKQPFQLPKTSYGFFVVKNVKSKVCRTLS